MVPKDRVTLGLCSQRELDALVARAAKKAGIEAPTDVRLDGDREALIEELRKERDDAARRIDEAHHVEAQAIEAVAEWIRSEEHTSELQSLMRISYAVFCLKKKKQYKIKR